MAMPPAANGNHAAQTVRADVDIELALASAEDPGAHMIAATRHIHGVARMMHLPSMAAAAARKHRYGLRLRSCLGELRGTRKPATVQPGLKQPHTKVTVCAQAGGNNFAFSPGLAPETASASERQRLNASASSSGGSGLHSAGAAPGSNQFARQSGLRSNFANVFLNFNNEPCCKLDRSCTA